MALEAYFVITDAKGDKSTVVIPFSAIDDLAYIPEAVTGFAELINELTVGAIIEAGMRVPVDVSGRIRTLADASADVQEGARFIFSTAGGFRKSLVLPTVNEAIFVANSASVNLVLSDVAVFIDAMVDGIGVDIGVTVEPSDSRGDDLVSLVTATEAWGKIRNRA